MLDDLINNHTLNGLTTQQLRGQLGKPDFTESNELIYEVVVDYGWDIDPVYTKNLIFTISPDSLVTAYNIKEWRHAD